MLGFVVAKWLISCISDCETAFLGSFRALMLAVAESSILRSCGKSSNGGIITGACLVVRPADCIVDGFVSYIG